MSQYKSKKILAKNASWTFDKAVPKKFDYHIDKSIPLYEEFHWLAKELSDFYLKDDSIVYDIGCSTGLNLKKLAERHKNKKKIKFYGIDIVKKMIEFSKKNNSHKKIKYLNKDINKFNFLKADLFISFYTIQFIHPKKRQYLINKIFKKLNYGGAFFMIEKVRSYDARTQDQMTNIYEEFKLSNGFGVDEISNKKNSLKGVLEPFSSNANLAMLKRAGFKDISSVAKFICFEFFLAIK
tara:strand:- start:17309 stop:18022 length:714 start_codon:yes stop_codon:yes gene_type:complete